LAINLEMYLHEVGLSTCTQCDLLWWRHINLCLGSQPLTGQFSGHSFGQCK